MTLYLLVPLLAGVVSAVVATAIVVRNPGDPASRIGATLVGGASFWAMCEVLWNAQSDPEIALTLLHLSALGWAAIGPLALHVMMESTGEQPVRGVRLPFLYGVSGTVVLLEWFTPWLHSGMVRTSWGWGYQVGPLFPVYYVFTIGCMGIALWIGASAYRRSVSLGERSQARWLGVGILIPLVVASFTDGWLPMLGVQVPRFGTASMAALAGVVAWCFHRYGYSLLAPGNLADQIFETMPDGVALLRLDGRIRIANGALSGLLDVTPTELIDFQLPHRLSGFPEDLTETVTELQCDLVTPTGHRLTVSTSTEVLRDKRGAAIGLVMVIRDLDEVVSLRHRLALSGRLAAVGEMAAGIAHEINNPLAFARANMSLLREHWSALSDEVRKHTVADAALLREGEELIDESLEGVDRAVAIVRDVRGLAHAGGGNRKVANINDLLDGVLRLAAPQLRACATIEKHYADEVVLSCAPQELQQVFLNLILNAVQALDDTGTIRVYTEVEADAVVVRIEDTGCGISPEVLERIFDPFFTTKPVGEGTGLGLGITYEIVRKHGGEIAVESTPGVGSCFRVRLPVEADTLDPDFDPD